MANILVEVTQEEAHWLSAVAYLAEHREPLPELVSSRRLADRFRVAASGNVEPTRLIGEHIIIGRVMT